MESADPRVATSLALKAELKALIEAFPSMKLIDEDKKVGYVIRGRKLENEIRQVCITRTEMGVTPEQFCKVWADIRNMLSINQERVKQYDVISEDELPGGIKVQTYATIGKSPPIPFVSARLGLDTKYFFPEDHLYLITARDNKAIREEYRAKNKDLTKSLEDASTILGVFKYTPVLDKDGKVIGTEIFHSMAQDLGGSIPKLLIKKMIPKVLPEMLQMITNEAKKM